VYEVEKNSKEWADKLDAASKSRLDAAVTGAKEALRSGNADGIGARSTSCNRLLGRGGVGVPAARVPKPSGGTDGEPAASPPRTPRRKTWSTRLRNRGRRQKQEAVKGGADVCTDSGLAEVRRVGGDGVVFGLAFASALDCPRRGTPPSARGNTARRLGASYRSARHSCCCIRLDLGAAFAAVAEHVSRRCIREVERHERANARRCRRASKTSSRSRAGRRSSRVPVGLHRLPRRLHPHQNHVVQGAIA